jgi:hypothetical protein
LEKYDAVTAYETHSYGSNNLYKKTNAPIKKIGALEKRRVVMKPKLSNNKVKRFS